MTFVTTENIAYIFVISCKWKLPLAASNWWTPEICVWNLIKLIFSYLSCGGYLILSFYVFAFNLTDFRHIIESIWQPGTQCITCLTISNGSLLENFELSHLGNNFPVATPGNEDNAGCASSNWSWGCHSVTITIDVQVFMYAMLYRWCRLWLL
jgi:hypothetical protein